MTIIQQPPTPGGRIRAAGFAAVARLFRADPARTRPGVRAADRRSARRPLGTHIAGGSLNRAWPYLAAVILAAILAGCAPAPQPASRVSAPRTGIRAGAWPACVTAPVTPGRAVPVYEGGRRGAGPAGHAGVTFTNTGTAVETVTAWVAASEPATPPAGQSRHAKPAWFTISPLTEALSPGQSAWFTLTLRLPAGTPSGAWSATIRAAAMAAPGIADPRQGSSGPGAQLPVLFLVGLARPPAGWPAALTSPCWDSPGGSR